VALSGQQGVPLRPRHLHRRPLRDRAGPGPRPRRDRPHRARDEIRGRCRDDSCKKEGSHQHQAARIPRKIQKTQLFHEENQQM